MYISEAKIKDSRPLVIIMLKIVCWDVSYKNEVVVHQLLLITSLTEKVVFRGCRLLPGEQ